MASQNGIRRPFRRRAASTGQVAMEISAPMLTFTNADHRPDLYAIAPKLTRSATTQSVRPNPAKLKKRIHIADLTVGRTPMFPPAPKTSVPSRRAPSPTSIGVALGSPTYLPSTQQSSITKPSIDSSAPKVNGRPSISNSSQSSQNTNTTSRRKMFSSIFGRKASIRGSQPEFYAIHPSHISQNMVVTDREKLLNQGIDRMPSTAATTSLPRWNQEIQKPSAAPRPEMNKSATLPFAYSSRAPSPPPKDSPPRLPLSRKLSDRRCSNCNPRSPMLKVDIPDIKLERYSVMFEDILKRPRQSLSARRHIHLEGLRISGASDSLPSKITEETFEHEASVPFPRTAYADISMSNTVNPAEYSQHPAGAAAYPKRTDSHIARSRSPSHGSETPQSASSDWQLSESPRSSNTSDEDFDDMCENIIIRLEDAAMPHPSSLQQGPVLVSEAQKAAVPPSDAIKSVQPVVETAYYPRNNSERSQRYARESSRDRTSGARYTLLPSSTKRNERVPVATRPTEERTATQQEQQASTRSYGQQTTEARPLRHLNPLKSSPASPTEIITARKLSSTRPHQVTIINSKQPIQLQITNIVNAASATTLEPNKLSNISAAHIRNRSEQVVIESV